MRHNQAGFVDYHIAKQQNIHVERAAAPVLVPLAAGVALSCLALYQELVGRQVGANGQRLVEKCRLVFAAPGGRFVEGRGGDYFANGGGQLRPGNLQQRGAVAKVAA